MNAWWRGLGQRQRMAWGLYLMAAILMLVSLPLPYWETWGWGGMVVNSTWEVNKMDLEFMVDGPTALISGSVGEFLSGPLVSLSSLLAHLLLVPSVLLLCLSPRSRLCCWGGRVIWTLLGMGAPLASFFGKSGMAMREGYWVWCVWISLVGVSFWVMVPCWRVARVALR